jgi:hypothetical protein
VTLGGGEQNNPYSLVGNLLELFSYGQKKVQVVFFLSLLFLSMTFHVFVKFFLSSLFLLFDFTLFWGLLLLSQGGRHSSLPTSFFLSPSFPYP